MQCAIMAPKSAGPCSELKDFGHAATARDRISFLCRKVVIDALHADEASAFFQAGAALAVAGKFEGDDRARSRQHKAPGALFDRKRKRGLMGGRQGLGRRVPQKTTAVRR